MIGPADLGHHLAEGLHLIFFGVALLLFATVRAWRPAAFQLYLGAAIPGAVIAAVLSDPVGVIGSIVVAGLPSFLLYRLTPDRRALLAGGPASPVLIGLALAADRLRARLAGTVADPFEPWRGRRVERGGRRAGPCRRAVRDRPGRPAHHVIATGPGAGCSSTVARRPPSGRQAPDGSIDPTRPPQLRRRDHAGEG